MHSKRKVQDEQEASPPKHLKPNSLYDTPPSGCQELNDQELRIVAPVPPNERGEHKLCLVKCCTLPAAQGNHGYCAFHRKHFIPSEDSCGSLCLGMEFMPKKSWNPCFCGQTTCRKIGYPNKGAFQFSANKQLTDEWCTAIKVSTETRRKLSHGPTMPRLAYWHFLPEHRRYDKKCDKWFLRKDLPYYKDQDN
jgi:hypothetical protein